MPLPEGCERVFLIGPRGAGKSSVGRLLAHELGWRFIDTDDEVERAAGKSVAAIFGDDGIEVFRDWETAAVTSSGRETKTVIGTGGGVILRESNREVLRSGYVVWLTAAADLLHARMEADPLTIARRPALTATGGVNEIRLIVAEREPLYRACANCIIDTTNLSPSQVVSAILA